GYLWAKSLGLKDFGEHAEQLSRRVKQAALALMEAAGRPVRYWNSGKNSKEEIARGVAAADHITSGPICALTAVELCSTYAIRGSREDQRLHLQRAWRKCLFGVSVLDASGVRIHEQPPANLVSVHSLSVLEWARMAGAADGSS